MLKLACALLFVVGSAIATEEVFKWDQIPGKSDDDIRDSA